jgi:hypothetical protein
VAGPSSYAFRPGLGVRLAVLVHDVELLAVVDVLLTRSAVRPGQPTERAARGLPQGSPLSPLLANLVLEHLDHRLCSAGFPVVRFADDLAVPVTSQAEGREAGRVATSAVEEIDMTLGPKTPR